MAGSATDVAIVGAGVLGAAIAERLSRTTATVCVLEAEADVADHASKGNAGNTVSYYGGPGLPQTELINASTPLWEHLCDRLDVPYRRCGGLMVALDDDEAARLAHTRADMAAAGARAELLTASAAREREPSISPATVAALWQPDEGIIDPMRLTAAYARLAAINGVDVRLGERVVRIEHGADTTTVITTKGRVRARFVVNAAGVAAGAVSELAGGEPLKCWPRKGEYAVLDRSFGQRFSSIVFCTHLPDTKGVNVVPTTHGSVLLGPTALDHDDPDDRATSAATVDEVIERAARLVPSVASANVIKTFAANRPAGDEPHRLRLDPVVPNLLHVTDRSAGVSISPAAAERALSLLRDAGLDVTERPVARSSLQPVPRLRTAAEPETLLAEDPLYGQVVCVCEQVTAAEINRALTGPVPATSVEGVRKRTGASYGRCQGSLCLAGISFMTAMATGTGPASVLHTTRGSVGS